MHTNLTELEKEFIFDLNSIANDDTKYENRLNNIKKILEKRQINFNKLSREQQYNVVAYIINSGIYSQTNKLLTVIFGDEQFYENQLTEWQTYADRLNSYIKSCDANKAEYEAEYDKASNDADRHYANMSIQVCQMLRAELCTKKNFIDNCINNTKRYLENIAFQYSVVSIILNYYEKLSESYEAV